MAQETGKNKKIRDLMPPGFTAELADRTGKSPAYISKVIKQENRDAPIWDDILELASEWKKIKQARKAKEEALISK